MVYMIKVYQTAFRNKRIMLPVNKNALFGLMNFETSQCVCVFVCERETLWLSWNLICRPGWSQTHRHTLASTPQGLGSKLCATMTGNSIFSRCIFSFLTMWMCMHPCMCECRYTRSSEEGVGCSRARTIDCSELPLFVLGIEHKLSARAVCVFNLWAVRHMTGILIVTIKVYALWFSLV